MAFLLRAFWGSDRQKDSAKSAEVVNKTFQAELSNIRSSLEVRDDELQSLVEMIYDSSFPESQKFLKDPSKERLKAHKDTLSCLLFGLAGQGVPVTKLILDFTQKHGLDAIADTLITLLELVRPLLAAKEMPAFTSDDLLDAIDNQWHSSVRSSPAWGASATQSPLQSPRGSVSMSPRGGMTLSPRSPFSVHSLSGKLSSPLHTQSLGSISPGKSASLGSYFRMQWTDSVSALPEGSWDGTSGTPIKRSSPSMVAGSSGCTASLSCDENLHPLEENGEELNRSVRFPEISRRQDAQGSKQIKGAQFSDRLRGSSASVPSCLSSSEKLERVEEDMVRNTKEEAAESAPNERASYGLNLNMNKSSHMPRRSLSFEVFKNQGGASPVKLPAEDTQMENAQLSTVLSARASYSLSMKKPKDSRRSLSFEVFKPKESPAPANAQNEQILQDKPGQSLSFPANLQYSLEENGVVGDKDSLSDELIIKDKSPSVAETEEHEVHCNKGLKNQIAQGSEAFQEERVVENAVASKEFLKDVDVQLLKGNEVDQRRSKQPFSDLGVAKGSGNGEVAKYFHTLHVNSQESLEAAHEIGDFDQDHGAERSVASDDIAGEDAKVTLEDYQVEGDNYDSELSISAGWPLPLEEKVDDKEVVTSVAGMEVANRDEGDDVLEPVHKAAKHVENVESEQPFDKGIVYPVADVDVANRNCMDEESETLYTFGGRSQQESAQNLEEKLHENNAHCEDHVAGRIVASEDIAREYSAEPVEENEVKRDNGCALLYNDVGGGPLPVKEGTDGKRVDRPPATMDKNVGEDDILVHTFDVISLADSPQTDESMASQGEVSNRLVEDARSVGSTTPKNQDSKQPPPPEEDAESNPSSLHYKDLKRLLPLEEEDDGNPVQIPVADMDHADGNGSDEVNQAMLTSDINSQDDSPKKPEEMVQDSEPLVQDHLAKRLATHKGSAHGDTVPLQQGEGHVQSTIFSEDKEYVEEVYDKGVENTDVSSTPILVSLEESLEKVGTPERRTTSTMSKVPDIVAPSEENAAGKDMSGPVRTVISLEAQSTVDVSRQQREHGEAVVESIPDSFGKKLEQFVTPGSLATTPTSPKPVTLSEKGSRGMADPISPEILAEIPLNVESSEKNSHEADREYPLQEIDDPGKPKNLFASKVSGFRSSVDVSDKGSHETDMGEACGNGNSLQTSIPASSGVELEEMVRPSTFGFSMMSETCTKEGKSTAQEKPYTSVSRDTDRSIRSTFLSRDSNSLNDSPQPVEESAEYLKHNSEQGSGSNITEHVIAAREDQNARVAGGGQQDGVTVDPKQQEKDVAIEIREIPNTLEEKVEHKGQEEGGFSQSVCTGQEDRDLSEDEDKCSSNSSSSNSSSSASSSSSDDDKGNVSSASSAADEDESSSDCVQPEDREKSGVAEHITSDSGLPVQAKEEVEGHKRGPGTSGFEMSPPIDEGGGSSTSMQVGEQERDGATKHFKRDAERVEDEQSAPTQGHDEDVIPYVSVQPEEIERPAVSEKVLSTSMLDEDRGLLPTQAEELEGADFHESTIPSNLDEVHVDRQEEVEASGIVSNGPNSANFDHSLIPVQAEVLQGDDQGEPVMSDHPERQIVKESDTFAEDSQIPVENNKNSEIPAQIELEQAETQNHSRSDESEAKTSALKSHEDEEESLVRPGRPEEQESSYGVSEPETDSKMAEGKHSSKSITVGLSSLSPQIANLEMYSHGNPSMSWRDFVKNAYTSARESTSQLEITDPYLKLPAQAETEQPATPKFERNLEKNYTFEPTTSPKVHDCRSPAPHEQLDARSSEVAPSGQPLMLPVEHQTDGDAERVMSEQQRDQFNKGPGTSGGDVTLPPKNQYQSPTTHVQVKYEPGEAVDVGHRVGRPDDDHEPSTSSPIRDEDDTGVEVQESDMGRMSMEDLQTPFAKAEPVTAKIKQAVRNLDENLPDDQGTRGVNSEHLPVSHEIGGSKSVEVLGDGHSENGSGQTQLSVVIGVATDRTEEEHGVLRTPPVAAEPVKVEIQPAASNTGAMIPVGQEARGSRRVQDLEERNYLNDLEGTLNSEVTGAETLESVPSSGAEPETAAREASVHPSVPDDQTTVSNYGDELVDETDGHVHDQNQSVEDESAETGEKVELFHTSHVPAQSQEAPLETGESGFLGQGTGSTNVHVDETETKVPEEISFSEGSGAATREKNFFSNPHAPVQPVELGTTDAPIYKRETETDDQEINGSNSAQNVVEATDKDVPGDTQFSELAGAQKVELFSRVAPVEGFEVEKREASLQRASVPDDEGVSGRKSAINLMEGADRNGFVTEIGATKREKIELFSSPLVASNSVGVGERDPTSLAGTNGIDTRQTGRSNDAQIQEQKVHEYKGTIFAEDTVAEIAENMKRNLVEIPRIQSAPQKPVAIARKDAERATVHQEMQSGSNSIPIVLQSPEATGTETRETTSQTRSNGQLNGGEKLEQEDDMCIVEGTSKALSHHFPRRKIGNEVQSSESLDASNLERDTGRWPGGALRTSVDIAKLGDSKTRKPLEMSAREAAVDPSKIGAGFRRKSESNGIQKVERSDKDKFEGNAKCERNWKTSQKELGEVDQLSIEHPIGADDTKRSAISTTRHTSAVPLSTTRQESSPPHMHQPKHRSEKRKRRWKFFFCCSTPTTL